MSYHVDIQTRDELMVRILFTLLVAVSFIASNASADISSGDIPDTGNEAVLETSSKPASETSSQHALETTNSKIPKHPDEIESIKNSLNPVEYNFLTAQLYKDIEFLKGVIKQQHKEIADLKDSQLFLNQQVSDIEPQDGYYGWVAVLLGCVTVLVTILGVAMAMLSFIGFGQMKKSAVLAAEKKALIEVKNTISPIATREITRLITEGELNDALVKAVDSILSASGKSNSMNDFSKYPELNGDLDVDEGDN